MFTEAEHIDPVTNTTAHSIMEDPYYVYLAKTYLAYKIGLAINNYWFLVIVPFGFIGNILSFIVMSRKSNRQISCSVYIMSLALSDTVVILVGGYYWTVTFLFSGFGYWDCVVMTYLLFVGSTNGMLVILAMTFDRMLAIRFPLKAVSVCTRTRAKIISVTVAVIAFAVNVPHYFMTSLVHGTCTGYNTGGLATKVYSWISVATYSAVPFFLLIGMNLTIINGVRNRMKLPQRSKMSASKDAENQVTAMLLVVSFMYLVLTLPQYIRLIAVHFIHYDGNARTYALYILLYHFTNKGYYTNSAINFLLYCIGGTRFRKDVKKMFCPCLEKKTAREGDYNFRESSNTTTSRY